MTQPLRRLDARFAVRGVSGFTLVELLVAAAITVATTGAMIELARGAHAASAAISDGAEVQQKMRVAVDAIQHDLSAAGAGSGLSSGGGSLVQYLPPVRPAAGVAGDSDVTYATDRITVLYVPSTNAEATVLAGSPGGLSIGGTPSCALTPSCGFERSMHALVFDRSGPGFGYDVFTVGDASPGLIVRASGEASFSSTYAASAYVTEVVSRTYYLDRSDASNVHLMRGDGRTAFPLIDGVRDLRFTYYADPDPASVSALGAAAGTCVYSPGPPPRSLLTPLGGASLSELSASDLTDGPFCGIGTNRFDADLLRIRRIHVSLQLPSLELSFDVTPHNLNLAR
jgi:Tfp pilus assembly protein PilW